MSTQDDEGSLKKNELLVKMLAAPCWGEMKEGVGVVVADKSGRFTKDDVVFSASFAGGWKPVAKAAAELTVKLPSDVPVELGAIFAKACTAYRLLSSAVAGDVVIHYGAETVVGQCVAQMAAARGVKCVSLVKPDVYDPEDAVELLKNLGAEAAAEAKYALEAGFREVVADLGAPPSLVILDVSEIDTKCVNDLLAAPKAKFSKAKAIVEAAARDDTRDAHILSNIAATLGPKARVTTYDALPGAPPLTGSTASFDLGTWLATADAASKKETFAQVTAMGHDLKIFGCRHDSASLEKALEKSISAKVFLSGFRTAFWYSADGLDRSIADQKTRDDLYMQGWEKLRTELRKDPKFATPPAVDIELDRPEWLDEKKSRPEGAPYMYPPYRVP